MLQLGEIARLTVNDLDRTVVPVPEALYMGICGLFFFFFYGRSLYAGDTQTSQSAILDLPFH